jgi:hypothetical protein
MTTSASCSMEPDSAVGKLRALVVALLDLPRELRQGEDRNVELLGQRLEPRRDLGHLLHAPLALALVAGQQLQVVDDEQAEALLPFELARACRQLRDRDAAGLIDIERDLAHLAAYFDELAKFGFLDHAAADLFAGDLGLLGKDARGELLGRHFEREEADDGAIDRLFRPVGWRSAR